MSKTNIKTKKIIFVGGETAGPVMPLLALANAWVKEDESVHPIFLDLKKSVASRVVPAQGYEFKTIVSGKLRRYWSLKNLFSPILIVFGFLRALWLLASIRPKVVVGAGGYIQVPVIVAAWLLRIPRVIHQQDIIPTASNRICAPLANKITTTFEKSVKDFPQGLGFSKNYAEYSKVVWTGNPTELNLESATDFAKHEAQQLFNLEKDFPTVLVIGGGSGARGLNMALYHNLPELLKVAQVVHSTGPNKMVRPPENLSIELHDRYHQYEFINQIDKAYLAADVVVSRAGIGTITALSALAKLSIIVPMPESHQEWNAQYLYEKNAAIVLDQHDIAPDTLVKVVRKILFDVELQKTLQRNIHATMPEHATSKMLKVVKEVLNER